MASVRARARLRAAAARARPRVRACASRASRAARCRCIGRLPKRGFNNIFRLDFAEINLDRLQEAIDAKLVDAKETVTVELLVKAGVIRRAKDGLRLLGRGELKAKLAIEVHGASKSAVAAVEKAGGTVKILAPAKKDEGEAA